MVLFLPLTALSLLLVFSSSWLYHRALESPSFRLREVQIEGRGQFSEQEILKIAGLGRDINLLSIDPKDVQRRLEEFSTIRTASVVKLLPDVLKIGLVLEEPVAIVNTGSLQYANREGEIFDQVKIGDSLKYPLVQAEKGTRRLHSSLEIINWFDKSKLLTKQDLGDIYMRGEGYDGMAPIEMTIAFPPSALRKKEPQNFLIVSFSEDNLPKQLQRLEVVLKEMVARRANPERIRMELDKKVVVKIAQ